LAGRVDVVGRQGMERSDSGGSGSGSCSSNFDFGEEKDKDILSLADNVFDDSTTYDVGVEFYDQH